MRWIWATVCGATLGGAVWAQDMRPVPRPDRGEAVTVSAKGAEDLSEAELATILPVPRPDDLVRGRDLRAALAAIRNEDWDAAAEFGARDGAAGSAIVEWLRLRAGLGTFAEYRAFLQAFGDWPGLALLQRRGEASIPAEADPADVIAYFETRVPQTGRGVLRLAQALHATGQPADADALLVEAWTTLSMTASQEAAILEAHGDLLKPYHAARLDWALWDEDLAAAQRMMPLVDDGQKKLAQARLALQGKRAGVDALVEAVPAALRNDPGLGKDRMRWRVSNRNRSGAADLILEYSDSAETLGRPEAWANWRRILARQTMREGDGRRAYDLARNHHLTEGSDYADLEWLSGYLALRYLDDPARALDHFARFRVAVDTPISLGRAGYWKGRAHEALGDSEAAEAAYREAGQYQTSFYGLLAAEKVGMAMDPALTGTAEAPNWREAGFTDSTVFQAAGLFHAAGQGWEATRFLRHLAESLSEPELRALSAYVLSLDDPFLAVRVSKQVVREGVVEPAAYYPVTDLGPESLPVEEALALAIARRESEFHAEAVSHAGARGLMQLMPATAQEMSKELGLSYSRTRLTSDPVYNARLGSGYLAKLIEEFGQNYVLVSVGYNAGPHRARSWVEARGDPRSGRVDVVDWIEHIPFRETRNYVMRVTESLPVYRARLTGEVAPLRLSEELVAR